MARFYAFKRFSRAARLHTISSTQYLGLATFFRMYGLVAHRIASAYSKKSFFNHTNLLTLLFAVTVSEARYTAYREVATGNVAMTKKGHMTIQATTLIEQKIASAVNLLPDIQQKEVLDFVEALSQKQSSMRPKAQLSLKEIAGLPIAERHQYLKQYVPAMTEDFATDPSLTEFSELDMDDWDANHGNS